MFDHKSQISRYIGSNKNENNLKKPERKFNFQSYLKKLSIFELKMVGRSDIDDIEIDDDENLSCDADDSASNLSEPRALRQRASKRTSKRQVEASKEPIEKMEKMKITATTSRQKKRLMDKEREEFLNQFDQTTSERERRKKDNKQLYTAKGM